ncbi:DUF4160 domain-containing protein [Methylocystis sp. WRRC1]|nr:DUF4160 domain-containing protein [Methylocystis sp. WRRC1]MCC3246912.1 DUF4160 domain-containing protein [Methylocystis sp. WRRC1]
MPTVLRWKGYRFFFYSADGWEPAHIHVTKDGHEAKIWLADVSLAINMGFSAKELNEIIRKARDERENFLEAWHDHFED